MPTTTPIQSIDGTDVDVARLRKTDTIRDRCGRLLERARNGGSELFDVRDDKRGAVADYVTTVARERWDPTSTRIHGRMRHFDTGGRSRTTELASHLAGFDREEVARIEIDLVLPSVLLDAGAGPAWRYVEDGASFDRSEGLAVATFRMFMSGAFSSDGHALRTDAEGLAKMTSEALAKAFQVTQDNPLVGLAGRAHVLRALGRALSQRPAMFGDRARPGHLFDWAKSRAVDGRIEATDLLGALLSSLSSIWPGRIVVAGENLGDVWVHPALGDGAEALVPFHKLSQWLTYSLVEPMLTGGLDVVGIDKLTPLPEYRNGGLLLDLGLLELRDEAPRASTHKVSEPIVVEWRALTVALLDEIVPMVRDRLEGSRNDIAVSNILEGATWAAGRRIAAQLRGGAPPLAIESDGTVF